MLEKQVVKRDGKTEKFDLANLEKLWKGQQKVLTLI